MSKNFPVSRFRIGMRLSKIDDDDPLFFLNKPVALVNKFSAYVGLKLLQKFKFDYIYEKYKDKQLKYCKT